ncbi:hypothetical protein BCR43DRAFT_499239 [Syncephalastrum racemosum]|uniref:FAD-binding domain-containing protein n=1 Tax=Syncephalastrum racemosum TaxID=13706 RepID=A0A1X2GZZ8_SYNRA|nr:hypothetical protein BCR43DRAFT_499239 [Syncephalastrum racemosum]
MTKDPVLIIGGGLAGLTLANVLKFNGVPYRLFERDTSPTGRTQGWSINVQFALPYLKSSFDPVKFSRIDKTAVNPQNPWQLEVALVNAHSDPNETHFKVDFSAISGGAIRINRSRFREWLMEGIDVEWNKEFETIEEHEDGVTVKFKDGTQAQGSVVVGADGSRSHVCQYRLGKDTFWENTVSNPVRALFGTMKMTEEQWRPFSDMSQTLAMMFGADNDRTYRGFSCVADYNAEQEQAYTVQFGISCLDEEAPVYDTDQERLQQLKDWANRSMKGLGRAFYNSIPDGTPVMPITFLERIPTVLKDSRAQHPRVVIMGDAAHCMTPNRGEGGNQAMVDAVKLAQGLTNVYQEEAPLTNALADFEDEMITRASDAVLSSREATRVYHGSLSSSIAIAEKIAETFLQRIEAHKKKVAEDLHVAK